MSHVTAEFFATPRGQAQGRWLFPVVSGTPREVVQAEVARRLTQSGQAAALDDLDAKLMYPTTPWAYPLSPDNPPIGAAPPTVDSPPTQPPAPPVQQGPLPNSPPLGSAAAVGTELETMLSQWRTRHGLTSAEQYFYLTSFLAHHARTLVALERQQRSPRHA